jgi:hypothetical protein
LWLGVYLAARFHLGFSPVGVFITVYKSKCSGMADLYYVAQYAGLESNVPRSIGLRAVVYKRESFDHALVLLV